jgi:chorismate mutase
MTLNNRMPGIVMICDPSHIAGKRSLVPLVSRRAIDEGADGLMIEVHSDPENAMSDSAQQLKPESFNEMLKDLDLLGVYSETGKRHRLIRIFYGNNTS